MLHKNQAISAEKTQHVIDEQAVDTMRTQLEIFGGRPSCTVHHNALIICLFSKFICYRLIHAVLGTRSFLAQIGGASV